MIRESGPWKAELLRDADLIERWAKKTVESERRSTLLERKVFVSAYAIRRLNEAVRISSRFRQVTLPVIRYPPTGASVDLWNNHRVGDHYDFNNGRDEKMPIFRFLNLIIHSLIFTRSVNDRNQIVGFAVTSDNSSEEGVYFVNLRAFINLMRDVGRDNPTTFAKRRGGDAWLGDGEPPPETSIVLKAESKRGRQKWRVR